MKKIGIVSSFSDSCGNAYFSKILVDSISNLGYEVVPLELDLKLLQSVTPSVRKIANECIDKLCSRIKELDGVNIQLEPGLYGSTPMDIRSRFSRLISANSSVSVTLHSPRLIADVTQQRQAIKALTRLNFKVALKKYLTYKASNLHIQMNNDLIKLAIKRGVKLIVHTMRAKEQISSIFGYSNVDVHPLKIISDNFVQDENCLRLIKKNLELDKADVVIGMFGFINEYKGHTMAINTLIHLPDNFKLLIFGRQHPQTIMHNCPVDGYLNDLQELIVEKKLQNRVYFMGEYSTEDFINLAASVDAVWLPYVENGQDGSGIASICLDVSPRVLCSSSFAFDELFKLEKYNNVLRFDIGNVLELATKTKMALNSVDRFAAHSRKYTCESQAKLYVRCHDSI
ncbi:hypothetical protein [Aquitalea aquatilis]|uniref:hypothetical protein n=1 Tax=Aquitalea aquatilis TaxID=1537400 RepID=UPI0010BD5839|nr:hypothetical protein [Aquitalea aquatilis]